MKKGISMTVTVAMFLLIMVSLVGGILYAEKESQPQPVAPRDCVVKATTNESELSTVLASKGNYYCGVKSNCLYNSEEYRTKCVALLANVSLGEEATEKNGCNCNLKNLTPKKTPIQHTRSITMPVGLVWLPHAKEWFRNGEKFRMAPKDTLKAESGLLPNSDENKTFVARAKDCHTVNETIELPGQTVVAPVEECYVYLEEVETYEQSFS